MTFDKLNVSEVSLKLNGHHQEPSEDVLMHFENNQVARVYHRLMKYMARDQNVDTGLQISELDFITLYPIYYFLLKHLDLTKQYIVDIHFKANVGEFRLGPPSGFRAIAFMLDKALLLEGAGGRMRVINVPVTNM